MRTTEVFVEQVILGLVALAVALVLGMDALPAAVRAPSATQLALWIVGAYLTGILVDRLADSFLDRLERHHRAAFVLEEWVRGKEGKRAKDPFPEDAYRVAVMGEGGASAYGGYLRSRMRLMRGLSVLMPGIAFAVAALTLPSTPIPLARIQVARDQLALTAVALYLVTLLVKAVFPRKVKRTWELSTARAKKDWACKIGFDTEDDDAGRGWLARLALGEPFLWLAVVAAIAGAVILWAAAGPVGGGWAWPIPLAGPVGAVLCGWAWWRISETFFRFLVSHHEHAKKTAAQG